MDSFSEHMIKRRKGGREIALIVLIIFTALFLSYIILSFWGAVISQMVQAPEQQAGVFQMISTLMFPLMVAVWWGSFVFLRKFNIEFEYALTESELDIDKITSRKKRKRILNVNVRTFEIVAPVSSNRYTDEYKSLKKIDASYYVGSDSAYFAAFRKDDEKKILIFEPTEKMLAMIKRYCNDRTYID